eukprot:m.461682 g.461682  ORF g.461682 m.461682 type:complete len:196 (-) comp22377_c0_seq1:81-668(-)
MAADSQVLHLKCYCGAVRAEIDATKAPVLGLLCHCKECRVLQGAAMYAQFTVLTSSVKYAAGSEEAMTTFTQDKLLDGKDTRKTHGGDTPIYHLPRRFCTTCGTRINWDTPFPREPAIQFGIVDESYKEDTVSISGFSYSLVDEFTSWEAIPKEWKPSCHVWVSESILPWKEMKDGLPKLSHMHAHADNKVLSEE